MTKRCLLVRLPDNREVFTHEKNQKSLAEFAKSFGAKLLTVEAESPKLLKTKEIVKLFCDQNGRPQEECRYNLCATSREQILQKAVDVRTHIETMLRGGKTVRIKDLHKKFLEHKIGVSTLYRHLNHVRDKLKLEGRSVEKIKVGCYRIDSAEHDGIVVLPS